MTKCAHTGNVYSNSLKTLFYCHDQPAWRREHLHSRTESGPFLSELKETELNKMPPCAVVFALLVGMKATSKLLASRAVMGILAKGSTADRWHHFCYPSSPSGPHGGSQSGEQAVQTAEEPQLRPEDKSRQGRGLGRPQLPTAEGRGNMSPSARL